MKYRNNDIYEENYVCNFEIHNRKYIIFNASYTFKYDSKKHQK